MNDGVPSPVTSKEINGALASAPVDITLSEDGTSNNGGVCHPVDSATHNSRVNVSEEENHGSHSSASPLVENIDVLCDDVSPQFAIIDSNEANASFVAALLCSGISEEVWNASPDCDLKTHSRVVACAMANGIIKRFPTPMENDRQVWEAAISGKFTSFLDLPRDLYNHDSFPLSINARDVERAFQGRRDHRKRKQLEAEDHGCDCAKKHKLLVHLLQSTGKKDNSDNDSDSASYDGYESDDTYDFGKQNASLAKVAGVSCFLICHVFARSRKTVLYSMPYWKKLFLTLGLSNLRRVLATPRSEHFRSSRCRVLRNTGRHDDEQVMKDTIHRMCNNRALMTDVCQSRPELFHERYVGNDLLVDVDWYRSILFTNEKTMLMRPGDIALHTTAIADTFPHVFKPSWGRQEFRKFYARIGRIFVHTKYVRQKWFEAGGPFLYEEFDLDHRLEYNSSEIFERLKCDASVFRSIVDRCRRDLAIHSIDRVAKSFRDNENGVSVWPLWVNRDFTRYVVRRLPSLVFSFTGVELLNDDTMLYEACVNMDAATLQRYRDRRGDWVLRPVRQTADITFTNGTVLWLLARACLSGNFRPVVLHADLPLNEIIAASILQFLTPCLRPDKPPHRFLLPSPQVVSDARAILRLLEGLEV